MPACTNIRTVAQTASREWAEQQRSRLNGLLPLAADTHTLLMAAAETEANAAAKVLLIAWQVMSGTSVYGCLSLLVCVQLDESCFVPDQAKLQTAAAHVAALCRTLEAARSQWAAHFQGASISQHIVTSGAAAALATNSQVCHSSFDCF